MIPLVLLMALLVAGTAQGVQIVLYEMRSGPSCSSSVELATPYAVASGCVRVGASLAWKADCSAKTLLEFPTINCTGEPSQTYTLDNCTEGSVPSSSPASAYICRDVPASNLLTYERGTGCAADGSVASFSSSGLVTFPACLKLASSDSYQFSVSNNVVTGLVYNTSSVCTGTLRETISGVVGQCQNGIKFSSVSDAGTFGLSSLVAAAIAMVAMVSF